MAVSKPEEVLAYHLKLSKIKFEREACLIPGRKMTELYAMQNNGEKIDKPEALNQAFKTMRAGLEGEGL